MLRLALGCLGLVACGPGPRASTPPPDEPGTPSAPTDPCTAPGDVERVEVPAGGTVRSNGGVEVTYGSMQHDDFEDGSFDDFIELSFRAGGQESTWNPSLYDEPRFVHLDIGHCARVVKADDRGATLELFGL